MRKPFNEVASEDTDYGIKVVRGILMVWLNRNYSMQKKSGAFAPDKKVITTVD